MTLLSKLINGLVIAVSMAFLGVPLTFAADAPIITLAQGQLVGEDTGASHLYFGIPYAAPPVGDLRGTLTSGEAPRYIKRITLRTSKKLKLKL